VFAVPNHFSSLDTSVEEVALVEMALPIRAFASIVWKANLGSHGSSSSFVPLSAMVEKPLPYV
jgi:hypothetical protein